MSGFFSSTEFYVIASMAAAAVVAACVKPRPRGVALEHLLSGTLCDTGNPHNEPALTISCDDRRNVLLTRHGLAPFTSAGAVSLAVTRIGHDISIAERITPGSGGNPVNSALFTIDFIPPGRYHVRYESDTLGLFTAFSFTVREDNSIHRPLKL